MRTIEGFEFPETKEECDAWRPAQAICPLDIKVLAVARTRIEGTWVAYVGAVEGWDHEVESVGVLSYGTRLSKDVARCVFPQFGDLPYS